MYVLETIGNGLDRRWIDSHGISQPTVELATQYPTAREATIAAEYLATQYPRSDFRLIDLDGGCECDGVRCKDSEAMPCHGDVEVTYTAKDGTTLLLCYPCYAEIEFLER